MRKQKITIILLFSAILLFVFTGCSKQNANTTKTGIPILISKGDLTVGSWEGKLSESGNEITFEATLEQAKLFRTDDYKLVIYLEAQDKFFEDGTVNEISEVRNQENGTVCDIKIGLNSDRTIDKNSVFEVLLRKDDVIRISKAFIQEDENGQYVWKVENTLQSASDGNGAGQLSSERISEALVNPHKIYIETGISHGNKTEITNGLSEGDVIARITELKELYQFD